MILDVTILRIFARRYPNVTAALAELANLRSLLELPTPTVHVISDVHGEDVKLRQVINNASGSLRPLVERELGARLTPAELQRLLNLIYYPHETWTALTTDAGPAERRALVLWLLPLAVTLLRTFARRYTLRYVERIIPDPYDAVFLELMFQPELDRAPAFIDRMLAPFLDHEREAELVRVVAHVIRDLAVGELVVAGDLGDRGPRIDKVIDLLVEQPDVVITWGNHDADWMAACLGHRPAIATVIRLSLRYRRIAQLEEGYGISIDPVERLAREAYADDPATAFATKAEGLRDSTLMSRMQKAIAIVQFKLEGALFRRRPEWGLEQRALLHRIDPAAGTVEIDGARHPLVDTRFPTIDWADPYRLSDAEETCIAALEHAFRTSANLWRQMSFVASRGRMMIRRDRCAIFHGCVPVDEAGEPLPFTVDGEPRRGRALFDAIEAVVPRAFRTRAADDLDLLFYLWTGPRSPCFGKDKMATFETYFVEDKALREEHKNPYFKLIHDAGFCVKMLRELGVDDPDGFLVNGHVPVKLDAGEQPIKKSGRAITIDGAFAAAYGDKGFSLVLDAARMYLAQHHSFHGAEEAIATGADIVPTVSDVVVYDRPRKVGDTQRGVEIRSEIDALEALVHAFETNAIREAP
ncbi:MAG TPA: fructose-bisphosphatase class III [Kofleriaceae bacterium]|nr:fructose-bisphosphatase class III [Kofleriaceae bacterium]